MFELESNCMMHNRNNMAYIMGSVVYFQSDCARKSPAQDLRIVQKCLDLSIS